MPFENHRLRGEMNSSDRSSLLDAAYRGWQQCPYLEKQHPDAALDRMALASAEIEQSVASYLLMERESDAEGSATR